MDITKIKRELLEQKKSKSKGNIYHYCQVNFAYNSNKIEGSRLSEDETEDIYGRILLFLKKKIRSNLMI